MKTNSLYIILLIIIIAVNSSAQAPGYLWAKHAGGTGSESGTSVATDAGGNSIVTGMFTSATIVFGATTLTNAGFGDMFVVKYDNNGNVLWAKSAGGSFTEQANGVCTDAGGNIIVTGYYQSDTISFDAITLTNANAGSADVFIVKYDPNGNVLWAADAGGTATDFGFSVSTDAGGNVFAVGYFASSAIMFGATTLANAGPGATDVYLAKYDSNGNVLWAQSAGGTSTEYVNSISADAGGNSIVTGNFSSTSITFGATTLTNAGFSSYDMFIAKYDNSGNVLWAKRAGGANSDYGNGVTTDAGGNTTVTGSFRSSSIVLGTTTLTNAGSNNDDMFIAKFDSNGNVLWAKRAGGSNYDGGTSVCTDAGGNILVTGYIRSASVTFGATTLTNAGSNTDDVLIAGYDSSGNVLWAVNAGVFSSESGLGISTDAGGNIFVTGYFDGSTIAFGTTTLTNAGTSDMFIVKLSPTSVGIDENNISKTVSVYPNPFSSQTVLQTENPLQNATLTVENYIGQTVAQLKNINGQTIIVNRGNLQNGLYFIRLTEDNKIIITKKLVITD